jgi:SPP1 gp7 family putative phage head morphogenesis protein
MKVGKEVNIENKLIKELDELIFIYIYKTLFLPIKRTLNITKTSILENQKLTALEEALKKGTIIYKDNVFTGKFNAKIIQELNSLRATYLGGAGFFLAPDNLQPSTLNIARAYNLKTNIEKANILQTLTEITATSPLQKAITNKIEQIVGNLDNSIQASIESIAVVPNLSKQQKRKIAEDYTNNLDLYIKNFVDNEVITLRKNVNELFLKGYRRSKLMEEIKNRYGVSKRKAKFLAKQEMNLLQASFTESRYIDAGVEKFQWTRTTAKKPDPYHKTLVGKVFSLNNKPIINEKTGERGLPKQRYGCSCDMRPVFD